MCQSSDFNENWPKKSIVSGDFSSTNKSKNHLLTLKDAEKLFSEMRDFKNENFRFPNCSDIENSLNIVKRSLFRADLTHF